MKKINGRVLTAGFTALFLAAMAACTGTEVANPVEPAWSKQGGAGPGKDCSFTEPGGSVLPSLDCDGGKGGPGSDSLGSKGQP